VAEALGERTEGFARALAPREFVFPEDHGPHPSFQSEWWYFTGNLQTSSGRRFGFQLTFFRFALLPLPPSGRNSAWAAHQVYMAHLALTDVSARQFWSFERFGRDALGLAGARGNPLRVWLEDWVAEGAADRLEPLRLQAREGKLGIDLTLMQGKPVVLQGEKGLSRKSEEPGNASYYYSLTRMPARGTLQIEGELFEVEGLAWMDREWSTSALAPEQVGWDWFALQLSDGRELVYFQLRRQDGSAHYRAGTFVDARGNAIPLGRDDVTVEVLDHWQSPRDGTPYPARWGLRVNRESLDLEVVPQVSDQELNLTLRYWEGAVGVTGTCRGEPLTGSGYVELTGYGSTPGRR
jgi:predicted secreted hydrolase